jgi:CubicO group peptidase (beta-lactamase class C family)
MDNAIGDLRLARLGAAMPQRTASLDFFPGVDKTFTLGFMRVEQDVEGRRPAGSVSWAGIMNTHYWIDPTNGLIGVLMMQQSPFMSPEAMAVYDAFERAVYRELT